MVEGFCGLPGSGKTYYVTKLALKAIKEGRPVYANYKIPGAKYFSRLEDIFAVRNGVIIVDEINLVCPSRWWNKFPPQLAYFWSQTRKFGLDIYWTSQHWDRVDKIIREISNYIWWVRPTLLWHRATCYIPEQISKEKRDKIDRVRFLIRKKIYSQYNTFESIQISFDYD